MIRLYFRLTDVKSFVFVNSIIKFFNFPLFHINLSSTSKEN